MAIECDRHRYISVREILDDILGEIALSNTKLVVSLLLVAFLVILPSTAIFGNSGIDIPAIDTTNSPVNNYMTADTQTGTLNPVLIKLAGSSNGMTQTGTLRTDVDSNPSSETNLPAGAPNDYHSGKCSGGYFLVGSGGSADFGSPAGTISFWAKWDSNAPHGRFWGQHANFETRFLSNAFTIDWDTDTSLQGSKTDWLDNHWYFFAITWNQYTNSLAIYWGDETTAPAVDASTTSWTGSVVGLHTENNIMNSISRAGQQVDGSIDDFRYYSASKDLAYLQDNYLSTSAISDSDLVSVYKFENDFTDAKGGFDLYPVGDCSISRDVPRMPDGWFGDQIKVTTSDVRKLYALNGTFESGSPGTNEDWSGDGSYYADGWLARCVDTNGVQRSSYVQDTDSYVVVENEGESNIPYYRHYNGSKIYWYQDIDNSEVNKLFYFNLDYNYMRGPLGTNFEGIFQLSFEILNGSDLIWNWTIDLTNVTQRQNWFHTGPILVNITEALPTFRAQVVLSVDTPSSYVAINRYDADLDGDSTNGQFITVYLNNLELKSATTFSCPQVDLAVETAETGSVSLSSTGFALVNHTSWPNAINSISFTSNTSIIFTYSSYFSKMYRLYNSSYTTNLANIGTSFAVDLDTSVNITFYTYVQSSPEAKDLGFIVYCPSNWENATVEDPFGEYVTIIHSDFILVPSGSVDSVGWWKFNVKGINYAQSISTQVHDGSNWNDEDTFLYSDLIRCYVSIGTETSSVVSVADLEIIWYLPDDSVLSSEFAGNASGSLVYSTNWTLTGEGGVAGEWHLTAMWQNGTEVAFGLCVFEVYHEMHIVPDVSHIEADLDDVFTVAVYLFGQDNITPITTGASVVGNWSTGDILFSPNLAKGWWEVDINTTTIGIGYFTININATMAYHMTTSSIVTVRITTVTLLSVLDNQYVEIEPDETIQVDVRFSFIDGTGIDDATINVLSCTGPEDGLIFGGAFHVSGESGNYSMEITARYSGTYFVTLTASNEYVNTAATSFYVIVGSVSTDVDIFGYDSPEVLYYNQTITISMYYCYNHTMGIEDALVNVTYNPVSVIEFQEFEGGFYNFSIRIPAIGSYSVYLRLSKFGFDYADVSLVFNVVEVPTSLSVLGMKDVYYDGRIYNFSVFYNSSLTHGISDAEITPSLAIRDFFDFSGSSEGWYNFTLTPLAGNWNITFWLAKDGYEVQVYRFIMNTMMIPIELDSAYSLNATYSRYSNSILTLTIAPLSGDTHSLIVNANISFVLSDDTGDNTISIGYFLESSGCYSANITVPEVGLYILTITIMKVHHQTLTREIVLNSINRPEYVFASYLQAVFIGAILLFFGFSSVLIGRRFYTSIATKRTLELAEMKGRLDDAKNLIGILVIHRSVGLPIYSKIIKGGFQESLLSSFISALSQFRAEFSWDEPKWTALPVTEVITVVLTDSLICAMITVDEASLNQKNELELFGREIGVLYDQNEDLINKMARRREFSNSLDPIFDSYFDGLLLKRYVGAKDDIPERLTLIKTTLESMEVEKGVSVDAIIKEMLIAGHKERKIYQITLEAVDESYLIPAEEEETTTPDTTE